MSVEWISQSFNEKNDYLSQGKDGEDWSIQEESF